MVFDIILLKKSRFVVLHCLYSVADIVVVEFAQRDDVSIFGVGGASVDARLVVDQRARKRRYQRVCVFGVSLLRRIDRF